MPTELVRRRAPLQSRRPPGRRAGKTRRRAEPAGLPPLLALQRSVGNRAVTGLLETQAVQRCPGCGGTCGCGPKTRGGEAEEETQRVQREEGLFSGLEDLLGGGGDNQDVLGGGLGGGPEPAPGLEVLHGGDREGAADEPGRGGSPGGKKASCAATPGCPPEFCSPFDSDIEARATRAAMEPILLAGIATKVSPAVVPLWLEYLEGGSGPQDLSSKFGRDFTNSPTTATATDFLVEALRKSIESDPPEFPPGSDEVTIDLAPRIGAAIAELDDPKSPNGMDFNVIGDIPGNIAGGIGKNEAACPVGAQPSPFDDSRGAAGTARVQRNPDGSLTVIPQITFTVQDTIDLCPGNCGAQIEQIATIPMSRMEASGISGDVPFTVKFPGPVRRFDVTPSGPPKPKPGPTGSFTGVVTASALRIREEPNTTSQILGMLPRGTKIKIDSQTTGTVVQGNATWDQFEGGFVSDRFIRREETETAPSP